MSFGSNLEIAKWICTSIACILSVIGVLLPILIHSDKSIKRFDSFSGGILLSAGFAHLLEDATDYIFKYGKTSYPVSGTTAVAVFSALTIVLVFTGSKNDSYGEFKNDDEQLEMKAKKRPSHIKLSFKSKGKKGKDNNADSIEQELNTLDNNNDNEINHDQPKEISSSASSKKIFEQNFTCFPILTILIYLFFSMNSLLEGIKMGILNTTKDLIIFSLLVLARKTFEAFSLGLIFLKSRPNKWLYFSMLIVYSLLFPAGTIIAVLLKLKSNELIFGILLSASAGAFIYVGVCTWEVMFLNRRIWSYKDKFWHLGLFGLGIGCILLLSFATE